MSLSLRPYQELAIEAFATSPWQRQLIVLPTGVGKTVTGLAAARHLGGKTLWLAHREELITQPVKTLKVLWPEATYGIVKAERNEYMRQVVFASIQSAQQERRVTQLCAQGFRTVVVDEAHHALSPGYRTLLDALGCSREGGPKLLGLTATPERSDNGALDEVFQGIVFQMGLKTAIEQGYLVSPTVLERSIKVDLDAVTVSRGDYGQKQLDIALMQAGIVGEITAAYEEHCAGKRKSLIFVISVAQAHAVADALRARGHAIAALSGETPTEERRSILRRLGSGELSAVVNCMVLTEGFDEPSVDCVLLARPTQSKPLMIQMVGRGLRLHPSKSDCLVIDMVGASKRNTMIQAAVLFGVKADPNAEPVKPLDFDPITDPEEYWRQRLLSQINGVKGAPRSKLRWLAAGDSVGWLLPAGEFGTVRMIPVDGDTWQVDVVGAMSGERFTRLSDQPVSMDIAQAISEDYVRRVKAVTLASSTAKWREGEASEKQIQMLKRNGVNGEGITKGTAADLITQFQAKQAVEPATVKQIAFLRRSGVSVREGITKREAMRLIVKARSAHG